MKCSAMPIWAWPISCQYNSIGFLNCSLFTQEICNSVCMGYMVVFVMRALASLVWSYLASLGIHITSPGALWWSVVLYQWTWPISCQYISIGFLKCSLFTQRYVTVYAWGIWQGWWGGLWWVWCRVIWRAWVFIYFNARDLMKCAITMGVANFLSIRFYWLPELLPFHSVICNGVYMEYMAKLVRRT